MVIDCWLQWTARRAVAIPARVQVAGAVVMFMAVTALCYPMQLAKTARGHTDDRSMAQRTVSQGIPRMATVLILSTSAEAFSEQVLDRDWDWGSRFSSLWMLPAIVNAERAADHSGKVDPAAMREAADLTRIALSTDLKRWHPNPVLVERCEDTSIAPCRGMRTLRLDLLQWLKQDAGFNAAWADYVRVGEVGPYDLWCRKGEGDVCRQILGKLHAEASPAAFTTTVSSDQRPPDLSASSRSSESYFPDGFATEQDTNSRSKP